MLVTDGRLLSPSCRARLSCHGVWGGTVRAYSLNSAGAYILYIIHERDA